MGFFPGAYVPLTMEGNIVVDEVLVSCYPSVHHDLAHIALMPVKWFPNIIDWMYGENNGCSVFSALLEDVGRWVLPDEEASLGFK